MPKVESKNGVKIISPTGWENFALFMQGINQGLSQMMQGLMQQKLAAQQRADQIDKEQTQFRTQLASLASQNPEEYNRLIADPQIRQFLDPERLAQARASTGNPMLDQRRQKKQQAKDNTAVFPMNNPKTSYAGPAPVTGAPLEAFQRSREANLRKEEVGAKLGELQLPVAEMEADLAGIRRGDLQSKDFLTKWQARWGKPASPSDLITNVMKDLPEETLRAQIPGTLEYNRAESNKLSAELSKQFNIKDATDLQKVRALADYHLGLREVPPEKLPQTFAALNFELEKRGQALREKEIGFNQAQHQEASRQRQLGLAFDLMKAGVPAAEAISGVETYMKGGAMPEFNIAPDKRAELEIKKLEVEIEQKKADLDKARTEDPEINNLFKLVTLVPQAERMDDPYMGKLVARLKEKHGITFPEKDKTWMQKFWGSVQRGTLTSDVISGVGRKLGITGGSAPKKVGETPDMPPLDRMPAAQTSGSAYMVEPPPSNIQWSPELELTVKRTILDAGQKITGADASRKLVIKMTLEDLKKALDEKDWSRVLTLQEDLKYQVEGIKGGGF